MNLTSSFTQLSESEQRIVAERILALKESGWKPFWCPRPHCDGMPHPVLDAAGAKTYVAETEASTDARPIGDNWQRGDGTEVVLDEDDVIDEVYLGRVLLDPQWAHNHAREDQRLPPWNEPWTLFIMSGRGTGKTTTGVEFVTLCARKGLNGAIVGRRGTELENTHVATLIARAHPEFMPVYSSSKDIITWPNGAITYLFSAERPENIRSVNLSYAWVDEAAWMDEIVKAWSNLVLATRVKSPGNPIHMLITSTPTPTEWTMKMEDNEDVEIRRVSTYANKANLDSGFITDLEKEYAGTRMGRQEIDGEVLRDVVGAFWNDDMHHHLKVDAAAYEDLVDSMDDRVLAIDPAGSKGPRSDAHGIIGVGVQSTDENGAEMSASQFYLLADATIKGDQTEMCREAFKAARHMKANRIIVEKNFGGEAVKQNLVDYAKLHPEEAMTEQGDNIADTIKLEHAVKSKETRAEPTVGKYEQGRVTHVVSPGIYGDMSKIEKEQVMWVPKSRGGKSASPNRIDAEVWAIRALDKGAKHKTTTAGAKQTMSKLKRRGPARGGPPGR